MLQGRKRSKRRGATQKATSYDHSNHHRLPSPGRKGKTLGKKRKKGGKGVPPPLPARNFLIVGVCPGSRKRTIRKRKKDWSPGCPTSYEFPLSSPPVYYTIPMRKEKKEVENRFFALSILTTALTFNKKKKGKEKREKPAV